MDGWEIDCRVLVGVNVLVVVIVTVSLLIFIIIGFIKITNIYLGKNTGRPRKERRTLIQNTGFGEFFKLDFSFLVFYKKRANLRLHRLSRILG